jgi:methyl-accepting chemotaxis protein
MNVFNNLKLGVKLIGGFLLIALIIVVVAVVGYINMQGLNTSMTSLYHDSTLPIQQVGAANAALYAIRGDVFKYLLLPDQRAQTAQTIEANKQIIVEELNKYRATDPVSEEEEEVALAAFDQAWADYQKGLEKVIAETDAGDEAQALESLKDGGATSNAR